MRYSDPEDRYWWWHEAVFGKKPSQKTIPHEVLRDYLDLLRLRKFQPGLFNFRVVYSNNPIRHRIEQ